MSVPSLVEQLAAAVEELTSLRAEIVRLRGLLDLDDARETEPPGAWEPTLFVEPTEILPTVDRRSSPTDKIHLFRALFSGRDDVFALRWQNDRPESQVGHRQSLVGGRTRNDRTASTSR